MVTEFVRWPFLVCKLAILNLFMMTTVNLVAEESLDLAKRVASSVGIGRDGKCHQCHETSSSRVIRSWAWQAYDIWNQCYQFDGRPKGSAEATIRCLAGDSDSSTITFDPAKLGFINAGLHLPQFQQLFVEAFGADQGPDKYQKAVENAKMPRFGFEPLTEEQYADLVLWLKAGMPHLNQILQPFQGPVTCEIKTSDRVKNHIRVMHQEGWKRRNEDEGILMFACDSDHNALACFQQEANGQSLFPKSKDVNWASDWTDPFPLANLRFLTEINQRTEYWIRSSADGRFVAYGGYPSRIIDLQNILRNQSPKTISVDAYFDPSFFPDNSAFIFQGDETGICQQSILYRRDLNHIDFRDPLCSADNATSIPLYQAVGASLDGGDYWAVTGLFYSDRGNGQLALEKTRDNIPTFNPYSELKIFPIRFDGQRWHRDDPTIFRTPWEADWNVSPSNSLLISRFVGQVNDQLQHIGYHVYYRDPKIDLTDFTLQPGQPDARLCSRGLKGRFSYDERFFVTYQYVERGDFEKLGYASPDDPEFKKLLAEGAANLILIDVYDGQEILLTRVNPGQFLLFPHFRSDQWIYALVYDANTNRRFVVASDAALHVERNKPL